MDVDRHPRGVGERAPELHHRRRGVGRHLRRRAHHVGEPGVGNEHHRGAPEVQQDAEAPVTQLRPALLPAVPTVVVEVERERLEEEDPDVDPHGDREDLRQVAPYARVERDQPEDQNRTPDRGGRIGHEQQACELLGQLVVALLPTEDADRLRHHREHRHAQNERREVEVKLSRDPDRRPTSDDREIAVLPWDVLLCGGRFRGDRDSKKRGQSPPGQEAAKVQARAPGPLRHQSNHRSGLRPSCPAGRTAVASRSRLACSSGPRP